MAFGISSKGSGHGKLYCRKDNSRTGVCVTLRRLWRPLKWVDFRRGWLGRELLVLSFLKNLKELA